jgi:hypothetical protein
VRTAFPPQPPCHHTCSGEAPWLRLKLYCTGAIASDVARSSSDTASTPTSPDVLVKGTTDKELQELGVGAAAMGLPPQPSAFGWSTVRPMQPRELNKWQLGAALVVSWLGGFLGAVQAQSGIIEKWYPGWTLHDSWLVRALTTTKCLPPG